MHKKQCLQIKRMPPDNNVCQKRFAHFFELIYPANHLRKISEILSQIKSMLWLYFFSSSLGFSESTPQTLLFIVFFSIVLVTYTYANTSTLEYTCTTCQGTSLELKFVFFFFFYKQLRSHLETPYFTVKYSLSCSYSAFPWKAWDSSVTATRTPHNADSFNKLYN